MILVVVVGAYETDINSCGKCYSSGETMHCTDLQFTSSFCCSEAQSEQCLQKYTYCTKGLQSATYKQLTCPIQKECPQAKFVTHTEHWSPVKTQLKWEKGSKSINCRVIVKGDASLPGKITIELLEDDGALPLIFFQPSRIVSGSTHGIVENYKMRFPGLKKDGISVYKVPADWSVFLMYNVSDFNGGLKLRSWASPFESEDEFNSISKEFKTARKFVAAQPESEDLLFVGLMGIPFGVLLLALLGYCACQQM